MLKRIHYNRAAIKLCSKELRFPVSSALNTRFKESRLHCPTEARCPLINVLTSSIESQDSKKFEKILFVYPSLSNYEYQDFKRGITRLKSYKYICLNKH